MIFFYLHKESEFLLSRELNGVLYGHVNYILYKYVLDNG
jgi:hypothetical protein